MFSQKRQIDLSYPWRNQGKINRHCMQNNYIHIYFFQILTIFNGFEIKVDIPSIPSICSLFFTGLFKNLFP